MANVEKKHEKQKALEQAHKEFVEKCRAIFGKGIEADVRINKIELSTIAQIVESSEYLRLNVFDKYGAFEETRYSTAFNSEQSTIEISTL